MDKIDGDKSDSAQQREDQDELRQERKTRGDTRNAHLEAGRERAETENTQARERNLAQNTEIEEAVTGDLEAGS